MLTIFHLRASETVVPIYRHRCQSTNIGETDRENVFIAEVNVRAPPKNRHLADFLPTTSVAFFGCKKIPATNTNAPEVEKSFHRFSELCKSIALEISAEKCEVWSPGDPADAEELSDGLGMKFAVQGLVAARCPLGPDAFVQSEANSAADKTV